MRAGHGQIFSKGKEKMYERRMRGLLCMEPETGYSSSSLWQPSFSGEPFPSCSLHFYELKHLWCRFFWFGFVLFFLNSEAFRVGIHWKGLRIRKYRNLTKIIWYSFSAFLSVASSQHTVLKQKCFHFSPQSTETYSFLWCWQWNVFPSLIGKSNNNTNASAAWC